MTWYKTSIILPSKGQTIIACDITNEGEYYYLTHLFNRQTRKRNSKWWHLYYDQKDESDPPHFWMDLPPLPDCFLKK